MCYAELIGYDRKDIVKHAQWHSMFIELTNEKKNAISRWREEKDNANANANVNAIINNYEEMNVMIKIIINQVLFIM